MDYDLDGITLEIGFDSSGLYDIEQEKGYGTMQDAWIKGTNQNIFDIKDKDKSI